MDVDASNFPSPYVYVTGLQYCLKNARFDLEKNQENITVEYFKYFIQCSIDITKFALDHSNFYNSEAKYPIPSNQLWRFYNFISQNYGLCAELTLLPQDQKINIAKITHHIDSVWEILNIWEGYIFHNNIKNLFSQ